jgi:hypothetical protein
MSESDIYGRIQVNSTETNEEDIDRDSDDLIRQRRELEIQRYRSNTEARNWMSIWTAIVVSLWLFAILIIIIHNDEYIHLSDNVLIALLTTSTIKVIGLPLIVLRGLFYKTDRA